MRVAIGLVAAFLGAVSIAQAEDAKQAPLDPQLAKQLSTSIDRALDFLRKSQRDDGSFAEAENGPPITGLVVTGALRTKRVTVKDPMIAKAMAFLEKHIQEDGGIYSAGGQKNYPTAICLMAFVEANQDKRYQKVIDKAVVFLKQEQWDESEGISQDSPKFGGAGYGRKSRPDLSNTAFLLEALDAAGLPKDDPAYQRAILFISRCQNLSGEGANDLPQAAKVNDGGFYYTPAEDYNPGGGNMEQGLRSYASMTYAGLKSFIHAGVDKKDPRVQAAMKWIKKNYSVTENPGLGEQGLFYYYQTFAKALTVLDIDVFEDADGKKHDWRTDLARVLLAKQNPDGSWTNKTTRWLENDPQLVTAYALLALSNVTK